MKLYIAKPSGFCAGVQRALDIVERSLTSASGTVYIRHEIVHNQHVVEGLKRRNAVFVDELTQVPQGGHVILSAHGSGRKVHALAAQRHLEVVDSICPLVRKVHTEIQRFHGKGLEVILIGDEQHPEVQGSSDQSDGVLYIIKTVEQAQILQPSQPKRLAYVTQTTLAVDDCARIIAVLKKRFPGIESPSSSDICYAAQNRQNAVALLAEHTKHIIVVGSANSSNSNKLCEVGKRAGASVCLLDDPNNLDLNFLRGASAVGLAAGASSPGDLIDMFIKKLKAFGVSDIEEITAITEDVQFPLPPMPTRNTLC